MAGRKRSEIREQAVSDLKKRYKFFKEEMGGGGIVGHAAEGAYNLARAERIAETLDWEFEWENEPGDWEEFLGDQDTLDDISSAEDCVLKDAEGTVLQALGGITFGHDSVANKNYRRQVEAELALEALSEKGLL